MREELNRLMKEYELSKGDVCRTVCVMMDIMKKLNMTELNKPVVYIAGCGAELLGQLQSGFTPEALEQEERAENAEQLVAELEAKLATPVRLPTAMFCPEEYIGSLLWSETESYNKAISKCAEGIRAAGFKVEGDA